MTPYVCVCVADLVHRLIALIITLTSVIIINDLFSARSVYLVEIEFIQVTSITFVLWCKLK